MMLLRKIIFLLLISLLTSVSVAQQRVGMQITASRIEMLQRKKQLDDQIKITDLVLADGIAGGTEVIIKMPLM